MRYRVSVANLPGKPDIVLPSKRIVVFCDGDFWHGRNLAQRIAKLERGHNAPYWTAKIQRNVARDREQDNALAELGWKTVRLWETDILKDPLLAALHVKEATATAPYQGRELAKRRSTGSTNKLTMKKTDLPPIKTLEQQIVDALRALGGVASNEQLAECVARACDLSETQLQAVHTPGKGGRTEFEYRMAWARTKLKASGAIVAVKRKHWRST